MFDDPLKMIDQDDNDAKTKNMNAKKDGQSVSKDTKLTRSKKHKVLLAQLGELQHQQNKYSIEYLSEKEDEDQTKKEQYMH